MKVKYLLVLIILIQGCYKPNEIEPKSRMDKPENSGITKYNHFCSEKYGNPCAIPLSQAFGLEYIEKYVVLEGVIITKEQHYVGENSTGHILFANYQEAEFCNFDSALYIQTKDKNVKAFLNSIDGASVRIFGTIKGSNYPHIRSLEINKAPILTNKNKSNIDVASCGKMPPLLPRPPSPPHQDNK